MKLNSYYFDNVLMVLLIAVPFAFYFGGWELLFYKRTYYDNGALHCRYRGQMVESNSPIRGKIKCYFQSGKLKLDGNYDSAGRLDGKQTAYGEHGNVIDQWTFVGGIPVDGHRVAYWPNGNTRLSIERKDGKLTGTARAWLRDGEMVAECSFLDGNPYDGKFPKFDSDFKYDYLFLTTTQFQSGKRHGIETKYLNDIPLSKVHWRDDLKILRLNFSTGGNLTWNGYCDGVPCLEASAVRGTKRTIRYLLKENGEWSSDYRFFRGSISAKYFRIQEYPFDVSVK